MNTDYPRPPLTEADWNFSPDRVPDWELIPCLLWEYLRESATVRQLALDYSSTPARAEDRIWNKLFKKQTAIRFRINHELDIPEFVDRAFNPQYRKARNPTRLPWQKLPPR